MRAATLSLAVAMLMCGCSTPPGLKHLSATAALPAQWQPGERGTLAITVRNSGDQPLVVQDIDVARALLDSFEVGTVMPQPERQDLYTRDYRIFRLHLTVPAQSERLVHLELRAEKAGACEGDIDVGLDDFHAVTVHVQTVVGEAASAFAAPAPPVPNRSSPLPAAPNRSSPLPAVPNRTSPLPAVTSPEPAGTTSPAALRAAPSARAGGSRPDQTPPTPDRQSPTH